jgi:hypothetical protein
VTYFSRNGSLMALVTFRYDGLEQWTVPEVYKNIRYRVDI